MLKVPTYAGTDEERIMVIGLIDGKHWSAITTTSGDRTRIISVRRACKNEEAAYDGATGQGG